MRESHAALMARKRALERDLRIPAPGDPQRRRRALADIYAFIETYHSQTFYQPMTPVRRNMIDGIFDSLRYRTAKAIAAPRGEGKSTICRVVLQYCLIAELVRFCVICCATQPFSEQRLTDLKRLFSRPKSREFKEDFPELFIPCSEVERSPIRARQQTASGELTEVQWLGDQIRLPATWVTWCPSCLTDEVEQQDEHLTCRKCGKVFQPWKCSTGGGIVTAAGVTGAIRGQNIDDERPDLVIVDDPDDEESADSPARTRRTVRKISQSIRGLAGPGENLSRVMLCTIINSECVAYQFTSRELNPAWSGDRYKLVDTWPARMDLWETYVEKVRADWQGGDEFNRTAHAFYVQNRQEVDRGAVTTNPYRFDDSVTPDGSQRELSTLQQVFNLIADVGRDSFDTEYQNEPKLKSTGKDSGLTVGIVVGSDNEYAGRLNGRPVREIPEETEILTAFVDVQAGWLWFAVYAWQAERRGSVVEYGSWGREVETATYGLPEAIRLRLASLRDDFIAKPFRKRNGEAVEFDIVLVDSGFEAEAVYDSVMGIGGCWRAAKGDNRYVYPKKAADGKFVSVDGSPWCISLQPHGAVTVPLVLFSPDYWKHRCQEAWEIMPHGNPPGSITLFGSSPSEHREFGRQMASARFVREYDERTGWKSCWIESRDNHQWDTGVGNIVGRAIVEGMRARAQATTNRRYGVLSTSKGRA